MIYNSCTILDLVWNNIGEYFFPDIGKPGMQGRKELGILAATMSSSKRENLTTRLGEIVRVYVHLQQ